MRHCKPLPSIDQLSAVVRCDPHAGALIWLPRKVGDYGCQTPQFADWWNKNMAGKALATRSTSYGGVKVKIFGEQYYAHRVIYKLATGVEPLIIDHIDGDRSNNSISNLRSVTDAVNLTNKGAYKNNLCGHHNIHRNREKWRVSFKRCGKRINIGSYSTLGEAIAARDKAKPILGFHRNHGQTRNRA